MILTLLVAALAIGVTTMYQKSGRYVANAYLQAIEKRDYETAFSYYVPEKQLLLYSESYLLSYLESQYPKSQFDGARLGRKLQVTEEEDRTTTIYEVTYTFNGKKQEQTLSLVQIGDSWQILFPFEGETITVFAPLGATVAVDGKPLDKKLTGTYLLEDVLPDRYTVQITYPNNLQPEEVYQVIVPNETVVFSPYTTIQVAVETWNGMQVRLHNESKTVTNGQAVFKNVLPGKYRLHIEDPTGVVEPMDQVVEITENNQVLAFSGFTMSEASKKKVTDYLEAFYRIYKGGIITGTTQGIESFFAPENQLERLEEFEEWFISSKLVEKVQMAIEVGHYQIDEEGNIHVRLLEKVTLTNREVIDGEIEHIDYLVLLSWQTVLQRNGNEYTILDRSLQDSVVAYKDIEDTWIQY